MTDLQLYMLEHDRASVEAIAKKFNKSCKYITEVYHQMVCDGIVAKYDTEGNERRRPKFIAGEQVEQVRKALRRYIHDNGISKIELASKMGVSFATITRVFSPDGSHRLRIDTVERFAEALGLNLDDILNANTGGDKNAVA